MVGWDFSEATVRVLTDGLPTPPSSPEPGVTFPVALHRGERLGAVLFLRLWRNGEWDSDSAIAERENDGWIEPSSCSGGGWPSPYDRPFEGWEGSALLVNWQSCQETHCEDGSIRSTAAIEGMAAGSVASIRCSTSTATFDYELDSPLGAFIIVVEDARAPMLTPLDSHGQP